MPTVAKVTTDVGPVWVHYSTGGKHTVCRRFVGDELKEFEFPKDDAESLVIEKRTIGSLSGLIPEEMNQGIENLEYWRAVLTVLDSGMLEPKHPAPAGGQKVDPPITHLRVLYELLRPLPVAVHTALAAGYIGRTQMLTKLWRSSRQTFDDAAPNCNWTGPTRKPFRPDEIPDSLSDVTNGRPVQAFFEAEKSVTLLDDAVWNFVDYEVCPINSGGGIDVLMSSGQVPVAIEVKADGDKNAFFALLQVLAYAAELSAPSQLRLLTDRYSDHFRGDDAPKEVEAAVLLVNPRHGHAKSETVKLSRELNDSLDQMPGLRQIHRLSFENDAWVDLTTQG